jgi:hypothetical protein
MDEWAKQRQYLKAGGFIKERGTVGGKVVCKLFFESAVRPILNLSSPVVGSCQPPS